MCSTGSGFTPSMQTEWPDWNGQCLPEDLLAALQESDGGFEGAAITVTASADTGLYFLRARKRSVVDSLSRREHDIARRFADGHSHKEIARALDISPATVRNHLQAVYAKLKIRNKTELARSSGD